jgi:hypothetical protein
MLKVSSNIKAIVEEPTESENLNEFKGIYFNDTQEQKYYEGGAHFKYTDLCGRLEKIVMTLTPDRISSTAYEEEAQDLKKTDIKGNRLSLNISPRN